MHEPNSSRSVSPYADGGASFFGLVAVDRDGWVVWYFNASNTGLHPPHVVGFSAFAATVVERQYRYPQAQVRLKQFEMCRTGA